ncbi:hypothetical protein [Roseixanthobacter glucoisosaccharinicivorans]|uniref:hypothetical protein n=1 Tax=Roseixanthobacter glucoisosaccharinicivorans TaxID=3119923 RepID=UPI00372B5063
MQGWAKRGLEKAGALAVAALCLAAAFTPARAGPDNDPDAYVTNFFTGGGSGGILFAAGTANQECLNIGPPAIEVISASPGVHLSIRPGTFIVTGTDYGYLVCQGQRLAGTIVTGTGTGTAQIRVTYPPIGQWYTHTLTLPGR